MQLLGILDNLEWWQFLAPGVAGTLLYTSLIPDGRNELRWFYVLHIVSFALAGFGLASILPTPATASWWPASLNYWIAAILSSALFPILLAFLKNNDLPHKWLRDLPHIRDLPHKWFPRFPWFPKRLRNCSGKRWAITREHQFPTSLSSVFNHERVDHKREITLVLKRDGCYVTGNSREYPENDAGQFVLTNVRWNCDCCTGKTASVIIVGMSEIAAVMLDYQTNPES